MSRLHVAVIAPAFGRSADDRPVPVLANLVERLTPFVRVTVIPMRVPPTGRPYQVGDAEVWPMGGARASGVRRVAFLRRARRWFSNLHAQSPFHIAHAFGAGEPGALAACFAPAHIASVVSVTGGELVHHRDIGYGGQRSVISRHLVRQAVSRADIVTTGNPREAERVRRWRAGQIVDLVFGHDGRWFHRDADPATGGRRLDGSPAYLSIADFTPVNDHETLLEAFAHVLESEPESRLHLVGEGAGRDDVLEHARRLEIGYAVRLHAPRVNTEMPALYHEADVLVVSARHATHPTVVLEAAACGCAIASTNVGRVPELLDSAVISEVGDARRLAACMGAAVIADVEPARERVREHELGVSVERLLRLYGSLASLPAT
jgi:glycosyltransferase involved in cell wall biosynthesis